MSGTEGKPAVRPSANRIVVLTIVAFAIALIVLLLVCVQLSVEITSLEEESRTLVEEVALLRFDVERMGRRLGTGTASSAARTSPEDRGTAEEQEA